MEYIINADILKLNYLNLFTVLVFSIYNFIIFSSIYFFLGKIRIIVNVNKKIIHIYVVNVIMFIVFLFEY